MHLRDDFDIQLSVKAEYNKTLPIMQERNTTSKRFSIPIPGKSKYKQMRKTIYKIGEKNK